MSSQLAIYLDGGRRCACDSGGWSPTTGTTGLLLAAGLVSQLGDYVLTVGLMYLVYDLTGSTLATAGMLVVSVLPQVLLASPAGVLVDRWDRRRMLTVAFVAHAVALTPLLAVHGGGTLWLLYVVAGGQSVLELLSVPAERALVPLLVPRERLVSANAMNAQAAAVARLLGAGARRGRRRLGRHRRGHRAGRRDASWPRPRWSPLVRAPARAAPRAGR